MPQLQSAVALKQSAKAFAQNRVAGECVFVPEVREVAAHYASGRFAKLKHAKKRGKGTHIEQRKVQCYINPGISNLNGEIVSKINLAIILAVSKYDHANELPACRQDAEVIKTIVTATGRFLPEHIICLDSDTTSSQVKSKVSSFLKDLEGNEVEELLFYYNGHGLFNGEFYYLFSDYDEAKKRTTSWTNTELDEMLRAKNPALAVKIIDACQSG